MFQTFVRPNRAGFSLIELLIVIAIILIILAEAMPSLTKARVRAQEMAAQKAINTLNREEAQYYMQLGQYAASLAGSGPPANGSPGANGAELIDKELASGEKGNFKFTLQPAPNGYQLPPSPQWPSSPIPTPIIRINACRFITTPVWNRPPPPTPSRARKNSPRSRPRDITDSPPRRPALARHRLKREGYVP